MQTIKQLTWLLSLGFVLLAGAAQAHHSYAIYDIDIPLEIEGLVLSYRFGEPHPVLMLQSVDDEGAEQTWYVEGVSVKMWRELDKPTDIAQAGEILTVRGWPARDGSQKMLLSAVIRGGEVTETLDRVRQREAVQAAAQFRTQ